MASQSDNWRGNGGIRREGSTTYINDSSHHDYNDIIERSSCVTGGTRIERVDDNSMDAISQIVDEIEEINNSSNYEEDEDNEPMNYDFLNVKSEHHEYHEFVKGLLMEKEEKEGLDVETVLFSEEVKLYLKKVKESNLFIMTEQFLYITDIDTMETKLIPLSDIDSLIVSTTVPIGLAIKYSEPGVKWISHKIVEIRKLPELLTFIEEHENIAVKVEYLDAFEVFDEKGKKEEFRFNMLK
jgi:hypothetical protein